MFDRNKSIFFDKSLSEDLNEEIKNEDSRELVDENLRLKWPIGKSLEYGVRLDIDTDGEKNEIKYHIHISRIEPQGDAPFTFEIDRSELYINEIPPDLVADKLSYAIGKVFYPLKVSVDSSGGLETICNHDEILSRWQTVKAKVLEDFEGELVDNYLDRMDVLLASIDQVNTSLFLNDWFLNVFFKPIYKRYSSTMLSEEDLLMRFPIIQSFRWSYSVFESLQPNYNDFGAIEIDHHGEVDVDLEFDEEPCKGMYKGKYVLHPNNHTIVAVLSSFSFDQQVKNSVEVKLFLIPEEGKSFDYDFQEQKNISFMSQDEIKVIDEDKKTSIWDRLFK